jgi:Leucine-rich repeat (LRR) protein
VTSRVLESIAKLESLRELDLSYTQIDDANFDLLADLPRLERLAAGGTRIGPLAITSLKLVPSLRHLDLSGMQRVDSGHWGITLNAAVLEEIGTLENLVSLNLSGAVLNDIGADKPGLKAEERHSLEGLDRLARLRNLEQLDLSRTPVNAAGLRALGALPRLRELRLTRARQITDDAVPLLAAWKSLQIVRLDGTGISPDGMARLRALRPDLRVPGGS